MPLDCPLTVTDAPISVSPDNESLTYPLSVYLCCDQDTKENSNSKKVKNLFIVISCCNPASRSPGCSLYPHGYKDFLHLFYHLTNNRRYCQKLRGKTGNILYA